MFYKLSVNSPNEKGNIDFVEGALFTFALGSFFDELTKMYIHRLSHHALTVATKRE